MSSVAEIESAIERPSPAEVPEVVTWLEDFQQMINASAAMFSRGEKEA